MTISRPNRRAQARRGHGGDAVLPGALAYFAWAYALVRVEAARLARTLYLVPAITILLSWALLGEGPGASALAGGALAIAGVVIGREASPSSD
jgi:drug/metabolite transporter (DMT)-like permease